MSDTDQTQRALESALARVVELEEQDADLRRRLRNVTESAERAKAKVGRLKADLDGALAEVNRLRDGTEAVGPLREEVRALRKQVRNEDPRIQKLVSLLKDTAIGAQNAVEAQDQAVQGVVGIGAANEVERARARIMQRVESKPRLYAQVWWEQSVVYKRLQAILKDDPRASGGR